MKDSGFRVYKFYSSFSSASASSIASLKSCSTSSFLNFIFSIMAIGLILSFICVTAIFPKDFRALHYDYNVKFIVCKT